MKKNILILLLSFFLFFPVVYAQPATDVRTSPGENSGTSGFLEQVKEGVDERGKSGFVDKPFASGSNQEGSNIIRSTIVLVADRAITFFSALATVLLVVAGITIVAKGSKPEDVSKQGVNIAAILGAIFFMHTAKVVVGTFYQIQGFGNPLENIGQTIRLANENIVQPYINLALVFLGFIALGFVIFNAFMVLTSAGDESKSNESLMNVLYGMVGLLIILLARPLVEIFYAENLIGRQGNVGDIPGEEYIQEPNFTMGFDALFDLSGYFLGLLIFIAISLIIAAGYMLVVSYGDESTVTKAQNIIKYVVVGLAIILSAYTLVAGLSVAII